MSWRELVLGMGEDSRDAAIVESTIELIPALYAEARAGESAGRSVGAGLREAAGL